MDEACSQLTPLIRRTWAPPGCPPVLRHAARYRDKVSLMGALTLSPRRHRLGFYCSTLQHDSYDDWAAAWFLRQLLRHLRGRIFVIWDRGKIHQGPAVRVVLRQHPRLKVEELPAYAPEINPVEQVWSYLKWGRLCNLAAQDTLSLEKRLRREVDKIERDQDLLRQLWKGSTLPCPFRALAS